MKQKVFDPDIDFYYAENHGFVFTSGGNEVSMAYVGNSHLAAAARIAELEARIAELEATQPLPEWTGNRSGVTAHMFGTSKPAVLHEVMPGAMGRLP